jgi:hypothetical protein
MKLTHNIDHHQASLLVQLWTGHIGLNHHLFQIHKSESPAFLNCWYITMETVKHFLLDCPHYRKERHGLQQKLWHNTTSLSFLLNSPTAVPTLLKYVHFTGRFNHFYHLERNLTPMPGLMQNAEMHSKHSLLHSVLHDNPHFILHNTAFPDVSHCSSTNHTIIHLCLPLFHQS